MCVCVCVCVCTRARVWEDLEHLTSEDLAISTHRLWSWFHFSFLSSLSPGCMHRGRIYPVLGTYWDNCNRW